MKKKSAQSGDTSVRGHLQEKLKNTHFRQAYEIERRKVKIGYAIHKLRTHAGLTQAQLAKRVGVTQGYIARLETADTDNYEIKTLRKLAEAFHKVLILGFVSKEEAKKESGRLPELVAC
jgi:DNA-binding XRE family transcriptional regulator